MKDAAEGVGGEEGERTRAVPVREGGYPRPWKIQWRLRGLQSRNRIFEESY